METLIGKAAAFERAWGPLLPWASSAVCVAMVWALIHFGDSHYVRREEFDGYRADNAQTLREIDDKLGSLVVTVTQNTTRLQDVQERMRRIEGKEDRQPDSTDSRGATVYSTR